MHAVQILGNLTTNSVFGTLYLLPPEKPLTHCLRKEIFSDWIETDFDDWIKEKFKVLNLDWRDGNVWRDRGNSYFKNETIVSVVANTFAGSRIEKEGVIGGALLAQDKLGGCVKQDGICVKSYPDQMWINFVDLTASRIVMCTEQRITRLNSGDKIYFHDNATQPFFTLFIKDKGARMNASTTSLVLFPKGTTQLSSEDTLIVVEKATSQPTSKEEAKNKEEKNYISANMM